MKRSGPWDHRLSCLLVVNWGLASMSSCALIPERPAPPPVTIMLSPSEAPSAPPASVLETSTAGREAAPTLVSWSYRGRRVAMARGGVLWFFDVNAGASRQVVHAEEVRHLVWSPDDTRLATESEAKTSPYDHQFELWDAATGALITRQPARLGMAPMFTADGALVAFTGPFDGPPGESYRHRPALVLFDARQGTLLPAMTVEPPIEDGTPRSWVWDHTGEPRPVQVAFDRSRSSIAIRWSQGPLALWNLDEHRKIAIQSTDATLGSVAFSSDEKWLVWGEFAAVQSWNLATRRQGTPLPTPDKGNPVALAMHPRRAEVLVLTENANLSRWDLATGRLLWETALKTKEDGESAGYLEEKDAKIVFLRDGARILVQYDSLYILDARTGRILETPKREPGAPSIEVYLREQPPSWTGVRIFSRDLVTGQETTLDTTYREHATLEASRDNKRFFVSDPDSGEVFWFDLESGDHHVLCQPRKP